MGYVAFSTKCYRVDGTLLHEVGKKILKFPIGDYNGSVSNKSTMAIARDAAGFGQIHTNLIVPYTTPSSVCNFLGWDNLLWDAGVVYGDSHYRYFFGNITDPYAASVSGSYLEVYTTNVTTSNCVYHLEFWKASSKIVEYSFDSPRWNLVTGTRYQVQSPSLPTIDPTLHRVYQMTETSIITYNSTTHEIHYYNNSSCGVSFVSYSESNYNKLIGFLGDFEPIDEDNPYSEGGISLPGGGGGNFSENSDNVTLDNLPTKSSVGTGFATLFTPSVSQLNSLSAIMWDTNIFSALQNLVENITDMFTSLGIVPFEVTQGNTVEVTWLGLPITEVFLTLAADQFYTIDMGSIDMSADDRIYTSGSALDYSPFSRLGIYLPFIGFQELDIDECRGCVIGLKYRVDILSGTCVAVISLNGNAVYEFTGNCLTQIPITSESMTGLVSDAVNVGIAISNTGATGAVVGGDMAKAAESKAGLQFEDVASAHRSIAISEGQLASATANAAMGMKPNIKKSGAVSASASLMSVRQPYLFLTTPRQCIPAHYQRYCGFPSNITGKLSEFSGYTVVEDIRLNGLVATSAEVAEIYELLKKGVII